MAQVIDGINAELGTWLMAQPIFFVATAPLSADQHVNCSPKGLVGTFTVIDEHHIAYLDLTGSGIETIAHLQENGRIVVMFMAIDGKPRIVRLHGQGHVVLPHDPDFASLVTRFDHHAGTRSIIVVDVERVSDSCGYAVPKLTLVQERKILDLDAAKRGPEGLAQFRAEYNETSIDGIPGLTMTNSP
jgi:hypothetical protein